jgi:hypothetical protein
MSIKPIGYLAISGSCPCEGIFYARVFTCAALVFYGLILAMRIVKGKTI